MNYTQIHETYEYSELQLIKSAFTAASIDFVVLDEYALESGSGPIMGFSGARIQVRPDQKLDAIQILEDLAFRQSTDYSENDTFEWVSVLENLTHEIPFINTIVFPYRIIVILFILSALVFTSIWLMWG